MIATGVESLDQRLGGLQSHGMYLIAGPPLSGKSILGLHFLIDGVARGEKCLLITGDEPATIESRAAYTGYSGLRLSDHPSLQILRLPERGAGSPKGLRQWLADHARWPNPDRLVIEGLEQLLEFERSPHGLTTELVGLIAEAGATSYVLLQSDITVPALQPLLKHAAGVFRLAVGEGGDRTLRVERPPAGERAGLALHYELRSGAGFAEAVPLAVPALTDEQRRRVIVLDELGVITPELLGLLAGSYDVRVLRSTTGSLALLTAGEYGALVMVLDPYAQVRAQDLLVTMRREGNAAPVVCIAPSRGLRSTTRSRCLRYGADDFIVAELPPSELAERIHMAWSRGAHRRGGLGHVGQIMQPTGSDGKPRLMTEPELLQAMSTLLAEQPPLFFCYLEFSVPEAADDVIWPALRGRLRVGDGDIVGQRPGNRIACVLDRITAEQTARVVARVQGAHPALAAMDTLLVIASPGDVAALRSHLGDGLEAPALPLAAHGA